MPLPLAELSKTLKRSDNAPVSWATSIGLTNYAAAVTAMETRVQAIANGEAPELVWLLEHPSLYSAGVSAKASDLLSPQRFPVFHSGRGGQFTYHGPGQRIAYVMLDLRERGRDIHAFVSALEAWIVGALRDVGVTSWTVEGRVGVWTSAHEDPRDLEKIAAIGVRVRKWVSFHGISVNVTPDLEHFNGIVPCGIADAGVTSLARIGSHANMQLFDKAMESSFAKVFGPVEHRPAP